jgi:hypothetical protein
MAAWVGSKAYDLTGVNGAAVFRDLPEGTKLRMGDGHIVEIVENARNGSNLLCKVVENEAAPSSVGEEEFVLFTDVTEVVVEAA